MRADAAANFDSANESLDAIASCEETIGRSVSQPDSAAAIDAFRHSRRAWSNAGPGRHAGSRISRTRFSGQSDSPECESADA